MRCPRRFQWKAIVSVLACCLFVICVPPSGAQTTAPGGAASDAYESGAGRPVGFVSLVEGQAMIFREDSEQGDEAAPGMPLFEGDAIRTMEPGRIRIQMKDDSLITLTSQTRLTISRSLYSQEKEERASFFDMALGKARFVVKKLVGYKRSEFKVKTKTAIVGVRGSDFTVFATDSLTEVTALENTLLEVIGLIGPEVPPVLLSPFEQTIIALGELPDDPRRIGMDRIQELKRLFEFGGGISETRRPFDWGSVGGGVKGKQPPPARPRAGAAFTPEPTGGIQEDVDEVVREIREEIMEQEVDDQGNLPPFPDEPLKNLPLFPDEPAQQ